MCLTFGQTPFMPLQSWDVFYFFQKKRKRVTPSILGYDWKWKDLPKEIEIEGNHFLITILSILVH